jgi:hypothetical protein
VCILLAGGVSSQRIAASPISASVLTSGRVVETSGGSTNSEDISPADGRLRGPEFTAVVTSVAWPTWVIGTDDLSTPGRLTASAGHRLVAFTLAVTQATDDSGALNGETGVTTAVAAGRSNVSVPMTAINQQIAGGTSGSAQTTGTDSFAVSVPAKGSSVALALTEDGFTQTLDLWSLKRFPPEPSILYRNPKSPTVTGTTGAAFHLAFTNPADGFSSSDNAQVSSATLTYFAPGATLQPPKSPSDAYLVVGLQSSYPDIPYGQPNSGHFFSSFNPMAGTQLTFTPSGGAPVDGLSNTSAFSSTYAADDDDGLFDAVYFFTVPATTTGGTLTINTGQEVGDEYTGFTGTGSSTVINVTASADVTLSFPAVPSPPPAQRKPPWVGGPLPATGLAAGSSGATSGGTSSGGGFPIWLAVLILVVIAAAVIVVQRLRRPSRLTPAETDPDSTLVAPTVAQPDDDKAPRLDAVLPPEDLEHPSLEEIPRVNVMGTIEISGMRQRNDRRIVDELLVYLVLHDNHHRSAEQIQAGLWPVLGSHDNVARKTFHNYLSQLRRFVGPEYLPDASVSGGYLVLGVECDWVTFQKLTRKADTVGAESARALRFEALALIRGRPFEDVLADSYEWVDAEHLRTTITVAVAECAQLLATDLFEAGELIGAENAARAGLRGAPDDFGLWDLGARAIDARADRTALKRWLADASQHLDPADMKRIRFGLTYHDPSEP